MASIHRKAIQKKGDNDPDNHNGVVTHLKSDILESEVKWLLGRITLNEDNGSDEIPNELFKTLQR